LYSIARYNSSLDNHQTAGLDELYVAARERITNFIVIKVDITVTLR